MNSPKTVIPSSMLQVVFFNFVCCAVLEIIRARCTQCNLHPDYLSSCVRSLILKNLLRFRKLWSLKLIKFLRVQPVLETGHKSGDPEMGDKHNLYAFLMVGENPHQEETLPTQHSEAWSN